MKIFSKRSLLVAGIVGVAIVGTLLWKFYTAPPPDGFDSKKNVLASESRSLLLGGEEFVLLSLNPNQLGADASSTTNEAFHRYQVLGKSTVTDQKMREELVQSLADGIKRSGGEVAQCFNPRHGIHARRGTKTLDVVICFECAYVQFYRDQSRSVLFVNRDPEKNFNEALRQLKLPLASD